MLEPNIDVLMEGGILFLEFLGQKLKCFPHTVLRHLLFGLLQLLEFAQQDVIHLPKFKILGKYASHPLLIKLFVGFVHVTNQYLYQLPV